ncbi:MAG: ribosome maturation factor RimP [Desulfocapsaceae bacterium]|nr:ribosome maturation factor RimP [Desulfocapsaceae bacterium]
MSGVVVERVRDFAAGLLLSMGLELVEVQFRREGSGWVLRLFIDREGGVTLEDCTMVSRELSDYLDVEDLIEQAYHLEVSSPGLDRPLYGIGDFKRFCGRNARVKLHEQMNGQRVFVGKIHQVHDDQTIEMVLETGQSFVFSYDAVNKARLLI